MFACIHCGSYVQPDQKFCSECGAKLDRDNIAEVNVYLPQTLRPEEHFQKILPPDPSQGKLPSGAYVDPETFERMMATPMQPAFGAADPFRLFYEQTERLLAGGCSNEETYDTLAKTYVNLQNKDSAAKQMLEQGRQQAADNALTMGFYIWALRTFFGAF
ncbi:MAG: zinc ribbon domain-containing protein [Clostridia bacterium]|nr:zinc ribbon domain-containing protein [Clostridia bacterium]